MYSLNLLSCLILLGLGSICVLTIPLNVGSKIPSEISAALSDTSAVASHDKILLDDIALALVQNVEDSESSSDDEGLIFTEPFIPADDSNTVNTVPVVPGNTGNSNGSIIGSETKVNGPTSGTGNNNSKSGIVISPDGNQTNIGQGKVNTDGTVVDSQGKSVGKVTPTGSMVDNNGNVIGKVDNNGNVVDNNGNTVATVDKNGSITPVTPVAIPVVGSNGGNNGGVPNTNNNVTGGTIDNKGNVVGPNGNVVGKVNDNGVVVDNNGNPVGSIDNNGNVIDNNGNNVGKVDSNTGKINPSTGNNANPQEVTGNSIGGKNNRGGELLYVLLPCFALLCGTGALAKKMLHPGDGGSKSEHEPLTTMNHVTEHGGYAPVGAYANASSSSSSSSSAFTSNANAYSDANVYSDANAYATNGDAYNTYTSTTTYQNVGALTGAAAAGAVAGAAAGHSTKTKKTTKTTKTTYHSGGYMNVNNDLLDVETGPSMNSLITEEYTTTNNAMLPAALATGASSSKVTTHSYNNAAPSGSGKKTTTTTTTTTTTIKSSKSPKYTTTYKSPPITPDDLAENNYSKTTTTVYNTKTSGNSKYLLGAAPIAGAAAYSSSSSKSKKTTSYNNVSRPTLNGKNEEEIIEEYIVEHGSTSPKFKVMNSAAVTSAPHEIVEEEYIVEGNSKPKKTVKKTITTYKTIYKNGVPVQVPVNEETSTTSAAAVASSSEGENKYKKMIPTVIETIVKHSTPLGDKAEEEKTNDMKKLMTMANVSLPGILGGSSSSEKHESTTYTTTEVTSSSSKNPKKTIKKTVYKTIYKNGVPVQVPVEEEETVNILKSPKLKGINKKVTTYNIKDESDAPIIEEFSLSPHEASNEEIPAEYMEYSEEFEVPGNKSTKQKTIKKYITVYKTIYKNGKPVEVVENIEVPEGKTPEEVIASLPKESKYEKRTVKQTVIESPTKESIAEERIVKPSVIKSPKVQSVKKYVTTYKTTYKNGVPVEETAETESLPDQNATESSSVQAESTTIEGVKSPKKKTVKKVTTYKTIYKNGKPVEVIEEVPEETVITAAPALITTNNVTIPEEEYELGFGGKKTKKIISTVTKPKEETEEIYEEYIIEEGSDAKNVKRTVYRNGVPVSEDADVTIPYDGEQTEEEYYEEYVIEDGKEKPIKKTFLRNGIEIPNGEFTIKDIYNTSTSSTEVASTVPSEILSAEPKSKSTSSTTTKTITKINGGKGAEETEEVYEEYVIEDGKQKTVKKTVLRNGVEVPEVEYGTRDVNVSSPYMKLAPSVISYIVKHAVPGAKKDSEADLADLMSQMTSITGLLGNKKEITNVIESREGLPSITEENENLTTETTETTYLTEPKNFNNLPKRSSSKRLSKELRAAVAVEIAKLENDINEETKNIPRPRKQSITNSKLLNHKGSEQSIQALAEGCLVRKPSNASSSAKSSSVTEEWSGPVFEKKVFEVVIEHVPQLPDEVKLNIGDLVEVKQVFEDGWAYGINTATKVDGTFPVNCLGEEREPNKNGRYVPRLVRVFQARDEAGKKDIEDEAKFKTELTEYAKKKKEMKKKKQQKKRK